MATNKNNTGENNELDRVESLSNSSPSALPSAPEMDLKPSLVAHSPPKISTEHEDTSEHYNITVDLCELPSEPDSQATVDNYPDRQAEYDEYFRNSAIHPSDLDDDSLAQEARYTRGIQQPPQDAVSYCLKRKRSEEEGNEQDKGEEQDEDEDEEMEANPRKRVKFGGSENKIAEEFLNNE